MSTISAKEEKTRSIGKIISAVDERTKLVVIATVLIMITAHGLSFTNLIYSHDALSFNDFSLNFPDQIRLGRFINPIILSLRQGGSPYLTGITSIIFLTLSLLMIVKLLDFDNRQSGVAVIVFTTNITLISLFGVYWHYVDIYSIAIFFSCLTVYARYKLPPKLNLIVPVICLIVTLGMYQTYMCLTIGLFLLILVKNIDFEQKWGDVKSFLKESLVDIFIVAVGMALYWVLMRLIAQHFQVPLSNDYNGPGNVSGLTVMGIVKKIPDTYDYYRNTFFGTTKFNEPAIIFINKLLLGVIIVEVIAICIMSVKKQKSVVPTLLMLLCIVILPLGLNAFYLISNGTMHNHMIYAYNITYLLPFVLSNRIKNMVRHDGRMERKNGIVKVSSVCITAVILIIGIHNIIYANGYYTYVRLVYDNTLLSTQKIWEDINSIDQYVEGETEVVFLGSFTRSKAAYHGSVESNYLGTITGASASSITYDNRIGYFYDTVMGKHINISYNDESIKVNDAYISMPVYPQSGYCKEIDGRIIVKMSE